MANLKEIRTRIASVSSTRQITSAMKMVSAAKFKKAQDNILMMRPYAAKLQEILTTISSNGSSNDNKYAKEREVKKVLIVVITSNRGLCGAFNTNILKLAFQTVSEKYSKQLDQKNVTFLPIGKKASDYFGKRSYPVYAGSFNDLLDIPNFDTIAAVVQSIIDAYLSGTFDKIEIIYNQFKNAAVQIAVNERFLPIKKQKPAISKMSFKKTHDFIFEPSMEFIVNEMIPKSLKIQLFKAILDSVASEHGARMTAMHKATDNASELIKELKLQYNKARQAAITNEILEIVGGAEALQG